MGKEIVTYDDLVQIVELIRAADSFSEFHLRIGDIELDLRRSGASTGADATVPHAAVSRVPPPQITSTGVTDQPAPPVVPEIASASARPPVDVPVGAVAIRSPMVGTFYRAPEPGARPFVEVGQSVSADTTVCIIEVMKLMNSIPAGCTGRVTHILANDAEPVDAGQPLIIIDPNG